MVTRQFPQLYRDQYAKLLGLENYFPVAHQTLLNEDTRSLRTIENETTLLQDLPSFPLTSVHGSSLSLLRIVIPRLPVTAQLRLLGLCRELRGPGPLRIVRLDCSSGIEIMPFGPVEAASFESECDVEVQYNRVVSATEKPKVLYKAVVRGKFGGLPELGLMKDCNMIAVKSEKPVKIRVLKRVTAESRIGVDVIAPSPPVYLPLQGKCPLVSCVRVDGAEFGIEDWRSTTMAVVVKLARFDDMSNFVVIEQRHLPREKWTIRWNAQEDATHLIVDSDRKYPFMLLTEYPEGVTPSAPFDTERVAGDNLVVEGRWSENTLGLDILPSGKLEGPSEIELHVRLNVRNGCRLRFAHAYIELSGDGVQARKIEYTWPDDFNQVSWYEADWDDRVWDDPPIENTWLNVPEFSSQPKSGELVVALPHNEFSQQRMRMGVIADPGYKVEYEARVRTCVAAENKANDFCEVVERLYPRNEIVKFYEVSTHAYFAVSKRQIVLWVPVERPTMTVWIHFYQTVTELICGKCVSIQNGEYKLVDVPEGAELALCRAQPVVTGSCKRLSNTTNVIIAPGVNRHGTQNSTKYITGERVETIAQRPSRIGRTRFLNGETNFHVPGNTTGYGRVVWIPGKNDTGEVYVRYWKRSKVLHQFKIRRQECASYPLKFPQLVKSADMVTVHCKIPTELLLGDGAALPGFGLQMRWEIASVSV